MVTIKERVFEAFTFIGLAAAHNISPHLCFLPQSVFPPWLGPYNSLTSCQFADPYRSPPDPGRTGFNPRAHVGRDLLGMLIGFWMRCFNPRAHVGRDRVAEARSATRLYVSIHAPTRGATAGTGISLPLSLFQSTRPRGVTGHFKSSHLWALQNQPPYLQSKIG